MNLKLPYMTSQNEHAVTRLIAQYETFTNRPIDQIIYFVASLLK